MPEYPHLEHAPIIEAVIDIRVEPAADLAWDAVGEQLSSLSTKYQARKTISRFELLTRLAPGQEPEQKLSITETAGMRLESEGAVLQLRIDGLTYSKLKPYTSWDDVFTQAWEAWELYRAFAKGSVVRIATRFINRMIFTPSEPVDTYIKRRPDLPDEIPGGIRSFFSTHDIEVSENSGAKVVQAFEPQTGEGIVYILDIDAYRLCSFDPQDTLIKDTLNELRSLKNQIFFSCITKEGITKWQ